MEQRRYYTNEYIDGNTVRKTQPKRNRVYVDGKRVHEDHRTLRAREKALAMNGSYVAFLAVATVACLFVCVCYLWVQAQITDTRSSISTIQTDINTLQSQNDAVRYSINSYVDSDYVYKVATTKLGMSQASDNQISKYKSSDNGYTIQYGDIPTE